MATWLRVMAWEMANTAIECPKLYGYGRERVMFRRKVMHVACHSRYELGIVGRRKVAGNIVIDDGICLKKYLSW